MADKQEQAPLVIQALQEPLLEALQETDTQAPVQNQGLAWPLFVRVVVYYFIAGIRSGRCLLTHLQHADPALGLPADLKKSTFFEAFRRFPGERARHLFHALLSRISFFPVEEMAALGVLCAVDGSHWPALFRMHWAVIGANKPTVLLHLAFGLNQMIPVAMFLTESNSSERNALKKMLQSGVTYVADRGYFAYYLLKDIAAVAFFVIRAPSNVTYHTLEELPFRLPTGVNWLFNVQDLKVYCEKGEDSGTWRMVRFVIGQSQFVLFSNRWELTTWQIITIYAYRWQIELIFLFLKRTLNGLHLLTHSRNGLENQFYCLLSAALLLLHFKQRNDAATTAAAPAAEPVQVPGPSGPAAAQPQTRSQTEARPTPAEALPSPTAEKSVEPSCAKSAEAAAPAAEPVQVPGPSGTAAAQPQTRSQTEARPTPAEAPPSPTAEKSAEPSCTSRLKRSRKPSWRTERQRCCRQPRAAL